MFTSPVVNQDGQPLIEGKLKEKQVRWKFIKRWKTRYFTLAGNQLLFRKGKSVSRKTTSLISVLPSSPAPLPRGFYSPRSPYAPRRPSATGLLSSSSSGLLSGPRAGDFRDIFELFLFRQQIPRAQHCDSVVCALLVVTCA